MKKIGNFSNKVVIITGAAKPIDIAKACFYLTDSENDFFTGQNVIVDGGMTKKMIYEE